MGDALVFVRRPLENRELVDCAVCLISSCSNVEFVSLGCIYPLTRDAFLWLLLEASYN